jgi:hypothetical protein
LDRNPYHVRLGMVDIRVECNERGRNHLSEFIARRLPANDSRTR